jgi:hypothetical protein
VFIDELRRLLSRDAVLSGEVFDFVSLPAGQEPLTPA